MITWTIYKNNSIKAELTSTNPNMILAWAHENLVDIDRAYIMESIRIGYNVHLFT